MIRTPRTPEFAKLISMAWRCLLPHTTRGWEQLYAERASWGEQSETAWPEIQAKERWIDPIALVLGDTDLDILAVDVSCTAHVGGGWYELGFLRRQKALASNRKAVLLTLLRYHLGFGPRRGTLGDIALRMEADTFWRQFRETPNQP